MVTVLSPPPHSAPRAPAVPALCGAAPSEGPVETQSLEDSKAADVGSGFWMILHLRCEGVLRRFG